MVDILLLHRRYPAEVVEQAVSGVLAAGVADGRAVAVLVRRALEGRPPLTVLDLGERSGPPSRPAHDFNPAPWAREAQSRALQQLL
jgi:hypothetical protein